MFALDDTIAAIASPPGGAARGIVRISGPGVVDVALRLFSPTDSAAEIRSAGHPVAITGQLNLSADPPVAGCWLPVTLFLWPTSQSYTREPLAEFHTMGSPPLIDLLLRAACAAGARLAQPGEFTLRAFLAGRIDLTQAEAVLGVVDAADRRSLDTALSQLAGGLSHPLNRLRDDLLDLLADLEAGLDFAEEDIRFVGGSELAGRLADAGQQLDDLLNRLQSRGASNPLPRVVLTGRPNVGKSSLFNAIVGNGRALVSSIPGTTRDYLTATIDAAGLFVELIDTAGLHESIAPLDIAGQSAARQQQLQADLCLLCLDATPSSDVFAAADRSSLVVLTKCDLPATPDASQALLKCAHPTSARTGQGLDELRAAIRRALSTKTGASDCVAVTATRIIDSVRFASESLDRAESLVAGRVGDELIAAEIRAALAELGKIVGAIYTDDLLDRIFSRFCIGK